MNASSVSALDIISTVLFGLAILHTFSIKRFQHLALKYPSGSIGENFFHLMGEVEAVFGIWAAIFVAVIAFLTSGSEAVQFIEKQNFTEAAFVFVIMAIAASRPILRFASSTISILSRIVPLPFTKSFYLVSLIVGPLLGSLITEPAAMTVTALILQKNFFSRGVSARFKYLTLAVLFVNVSIGGVLTNFAAPPVLMVARTWEWDTAYMLTHFGWKAAIAVFINATLAMLYLRGELKSNLMPSVSKDVSSGHIPYWLVFIHLFFLAVVVLNSHHPVFFLGLFLFFIGVTTITAEYQDEIKLKESLLVGFFLGGLVVLGGPQSWWLKGILEKLSAFPLYLGATGLTAVMDNAAITYLGSQVAGLSNEMKYALVAGAVSGGGLTVIANAPNPAGFSILKNDFGGEGISPMTLLANALLPTLIAMACLWLLP